MRRTRNTPAAPSVPAASAGAATPAPRSAHAGLRLCGSFEASGKDKPIAGTKPVRGRPAPLVFSDPGVRSGVATMTSSLEFDDSDSPNNPVEQGVLVNLAPYLTTASNHGSHRHAAGHPAHSDPLFAEISAVLDTMQTSIDSLKDDVESFKFPTAQGSSGPTRPAA